MKKDTFRDELVDNYLTHSGSLVSFALDPSIDLRHNIEQLCSINSWCYAHYGGFPVAVVPDQVKTRYESSQYVLDPNRFRLRKVVRILSLVYLFIQKCCSHCGLVGKLKAYPKVPLNFVPSSSQINNPALIPSSIA